MYKLENSAGVFKIISKTTCTIDLLPFNRGKMLALLTHVPATRSRSFTNKKTQHQFMIGNIMQCSIKRKSSSRHDSCISYRQRGSFLLQSVERKLWLPLILDYSNLRGRSFTACIIWYVYAPTHWNSETKYPLLNMGKSKCESMNNRLVCSLLSSEVCSHQQKLQQL